MATTAAIDHMAILHSKDDKPPKGFEKFFRRPKDGEKKEKSAAKKKEEDNKEKEDDSLSDEETETKKGKEGDGENGEDPNKIKAFFFDPNNNPKNEALFLLAALVGAGYFVYNF